MTVYRINKHVDANGVDHRKSLAIRGALARLGCSSPTLFKYVISGEIRIVESPGSGIRFSSEDVDRIAAARGVKVAS